MRYGVRQAEFFVIWAIFCSLSPLTTPKIKILKLKKTLGEIIILHICTINDNHMTYGSWDMEHKDRIFCHSGPFFALFLFYGPRKSKFWKMKKIPGDTIILQMCTINDSHMMYVSWDMKWNRHNFLSFLTIFCPFTPLATQKIKILKNWTKLLEILSFYTCAS